MELSRRTFLKIGGGASLAILTGLPGLNLQAAHAFSAKMGKLQSTTVKSTICPYCGVGCGAIMHSRLVDGKLKIVNLEGDPDHPINQGSLCAKGNAIFQVHDDPGDKRLQVPQYRAPGSKTWKQVSWDWAFQQIAKRVYDTREASFVAKNATGETVNRTEGIACLGGASLDNEECFLLVKLMRSMGLVYIEHQARI
jgi:formate dehydrogenase major subunit